MSSFFWGKIIYCNGVMEEMEEEEDLVDAKKKEVYNEKWELKK